MQEIFNIKKILEICNYIFWFLILNFLFMLFNIPIILFLIFLGMDNIINYFPLFLLCLIPVMPLFTSLLYCMGKIIKNRDLNLIKDFNHGIKLNIKQSLIFWILELLLIFILYFNIKFFSYLKYGLFLNCLFISIFITLIAVTPYIYLLISRFSMQNRSVLKNSLILTFTRPILTFTNILIFIIILILFEITPGTTILFISSIAAFLLCFSNKNLLTQLENLNNNFSGKN